LADTSGKKLFRIDITDSKEEIRLWRLIFCAVGLPFELTIMELLVDAQLF